MHPEIFVDLDEGLTKLLDKQKGLCKPNKCS